MIRHKRTKEYPVLNEMVNSPKKNRYAWVIFGVCFLMIFFSLGYGSSTKSTFVTAVCGSLGLQRSLFTIGDSLRYMTYAVMGFFLGPTVEKLGIRKMAGIGCAFLSASFLVNSFAQEYWHFYVGGILLGAGMCWTTTSLVGNLVESWFSTGKGTVMGFLLSSNGLGALTSEIIITKIVFGADGSLSNADSHWRQGYLVIAVLLAAVGVIAVLLIRNTPEEMGLKPLAIVKQKKSRQGLDWEGYGMDELKRKPYFYVSAVCIFMTGFALQSMGSVAKPYMYDLGFEKNSVIAIFAFFSVFLMLAKTAAGIGYDTIGLPKTFLVTCSAGFVSLLALYFLTPDKIVFAWIYSVVSAMSMPLETVMIPLLVSYMFGKKNYRKVFGYYLSFNQAGYAIGVPLTNLAYDKQGTYRNMILILVIMILFVTVTQQICMKKATRDRDEFLKNAAK